MFDNKIHANCISNKPNSVVSMSKYTRGVLGECCRLRCWFGSWLRKVRNTRICVVKCHLRLVTISFSCFGYICLMLPKIIVQYKATYCTCITFVSKGKIKVKGNYLFALRYSLLFLVLPVSAIRLCISAIRLCILQSC